MNSGVSFGSFVGSLLSGEGFSVGEGAAEGFCEEFWSSVFCICSFDGGEMSSVEGSCWGLLGEMGSGENSLRIWP